MRVCAKTISLYVVIVTFVPLTLAQAAFASARTSTTAVASGTVAKASTDSKAAAACPSAEVVGVRGSGETATDHNGFGKTVYAVAHAVATGYKGAHADPIDYPAIAVDITNPQYPGNYRRSVNAGINNLSSFLAAFHTRCSSKPIVLVGFSQGAQVAGNVYQSIATAVRKKIVALALFGDPRFNPDQTEADFATYDPSLKGVWATPPPGANGTVRTFASGEVSSVHNYCVQYDPVCNWSLANGVNCAPGLYCAHLHYVDMGYASDAATWALSRLPPLPTPLRIIDNSLPGATAGTPYTDKLAGAGGKLPYTWSASGSALSDGLSLDTSNATLSGTPQLPGTYGLDVTLGDAAGHQVSRSFTLTVAPAPPPSGTNDWAQRGYNAGHSFVNTGESQLGASNVAQLTQKWTRPDISNGSLVVGGILYDISNTDQGNGYQDVLSAKSLTDGTVLWSRSLGQYTDGNSTLYAIGDDTIVVGIETDFDGIRRNDLLGLNLADGTQKWHLGFWDYYGHVALDGDKLIAYDGGPWFGVLDVATGAVLWSISPYYGTGAIAAYNGTILTVGRVQDAQGNWVDFLEGLNETDGSVVWADPPLPYGSGDYGEPRVAGAVMYVYNPNTEDIEGYNPSTGALLWATPAYSDENNGGTYWGGTASDGNTVYAVTVVNIDPTNLVYSTTLRAFVGGQEQWHTAIAQYGAPLGDLAVADGVVYVTTEDDSAGTETAHAFAAAGGQLLWNSPNLPETRQSTYVGDGHLVLGGSVFGP
jgi:hypothetical protein